MLCHATTIKHRCEKVSNIFARDFLQVDSHHDVFELVANQSLQTGIFSLTAAYINKTEITHTYTDTATGLTIHDCIRP